MLAKSFFALSRQCTASNFVIPVEMTRVPVPVANFSVSYSSLLHSFSAIVFVVEMCEIDNLARGLVDVQSETDGLKTDHLQLPDKGA